MFVNRLVTLHEMRPDIHGSGSGDYYLGHFTKPSAGDPMAEPHVSDDDAPVENEDKGGAEPLPPMRILRDHPSQLLLHQEILVRGKFFDSKTGKVKTMTKRQRVIKPGAPFSKPHKMHHFKEREWPSGQHFDANDLTITANVDGSEPKHILWVPGMTEHHEQLVKFYQHIRKESLNKDTQFADQGKWPCKLPSGTPIEMCYWPESAFHVRRKKTKADDEANSTEDAPPAAKKQKKAADGAGTSKPAAEPAVAEPPPARKPIPPAALVAKGAGASKPAGDDAAAAEKALLTKIFNGDDQHLKHIAMACLEDMYAPCGPLSSTTPWTCTGEFENKSVKEVKEFLETNDDFDAASIDKIMRDLTSFRKIFKMFFGSLPHGWTPSLPPPPPKKKSLCVD